MSSASTQPTHFPISSGSGCRRAAWIASRNERSFSFHFAERLDDSDLGL